MLVERTRMSPSEAAAYIGASYSWLMREARLGRVPSYNVGHKRFFNKQKIDLWLDDLEKKSIQSEN